LGAGRSLRRLWSRWKRRMFFSTDTKACVRLRSGPITRYGLSVAGAAGPLEGGTHCTAHGMTLRATPASLPLGKRALGVTFDASIRARQWAVNSVVRPPEHRSARPPGRGVEHLTYTCARVHTPG